MRWEDSFFFFFFLSFSLGVGSGWVVCNDSKEDEDEDEDGWTSLSSRTTTFMLVSSWTVKRSVCTDTFPWGVNTDCVNMALDERVVREPWAVVLERGGWRFFGSPDMVSTGWAGDKKVAAIADIFFWTLPLVLTGFGGFGFEGRD